MMREQLTRLARAEEWKGWMLKRRAAAGGGWPTSLREHVVLLEERAAARTSAR